MHHQFTQKRAGDGSRMHEETNMWSLINIYLICNVNGNFTIRADAFKVRWYFDFFLFKKQHVRPFFIILNSIFQTCKVFILLRYCFWYAQQVVIKFAFQIKMFSKLITRVVLSEKVLKSSYESSSLSIGRILFMTWKEKLQLNPLPFPSLTSAILLCWWFYVSHSFVLCSLQTVENRREWVRERKKNIESKSVIMNRWKK